MARINFTSEEIKDWFENQDICTQRDIFREAVVEHDPDAEFFDFDESFFEEMGISAIEAIRAWCFGGKPGNGGNNNYNDDYIRYNGYGNFVTMDDYEAQEWMTDHMDDMEDYIEEHYHDEMLEYFELEEHDRYILIYDHDEENAQELDRYETDDLDDAIDEALEAIENEGYATIEILDTEEGRIVWTSDEDDSDDE